MVTEDHPGQSRNWWPEVSGHLARSGTAMTAEPLDLTRSRRSDEAKEVSRACDALDAKVAGLGANMEEIQKQLVAMQRSRDVSSPSPLLPVAEPSSPSPVKEPEPFAEKLEQLEHVYLELRETLEDRLLLVLGDLEGQVRDLLQKFQQQAQDGADRAQKLGELEVRVEMFCRRISTQEERLQSCAERAEKSVAMPQLRNLCREELQKKLSEEDVSGTTAMVMKQQEALREVQLQLQWLTDRLQLEGLRQAIRDTVLG